MLLLEFVCWLCFGCLGVGWWDWYLRVFRGWFWHDWLGCFVGLSLCTLCGVGGFVVLVLVLCVLCERLLICLGTGAAGGCFALIVVVLLVN